MAHTSSVFKYLQFLKIVDLCQLEVNRYILSLLYGLFSYCRSRWSTYLHYHKINIVTTPGTQQPKNYLLKTCTLVASQSIIQVGPQTWNYLTPGKVSVQFIAPTMCKFLVQIEITYTEGLWWLILLLLLIYLWQSILFKAWDRHMGSTPELQHWLYGIN